MAPGGGTAHRVKRVERSEEPAALAHLAEALLGAGNWSDARRTAEGALDTSRRVLRPRSGAISFSAVLWRGPTEPGATAAIETALGEAEALIEASRAHSLEPHLHEAHAEVAELLGDCAAREQHLREAHRLYTELGALGHAERVGRELS